MDKQIAALVSICLFNFYYAQTDSVAIRNSLHDSLYAQYMIPVFSTNGDSETGLDQQDVSSLLQSGRDVFTQFAGFQFGPSHYRIRGYSAENMVVMINGISLNNPETGFSSWSSWGGLNDVTRFTETRIGNGCNGYSFAGAGGYTNIDTKSSAFKKGTRLSVSNGNRIYRNRYMLTHSTGIKKGWAVNLSASIREGEEVYIPGTYFRGNSFYLSADKTLNEKHLLSFTGFVAPVEQGRNKSTVKEAYTLAGSNYYNSAWGYQSGQTRNANVASNKRPMLFLTHQFQPNKNSRLVTSCYYNFGKNKLSGLSWYKAADPRPDYYRYLPGYYYLLGDTPKAETQRDNWIENKQINWDRLISMNQANLYATPSMTGITSNESRARYIVENQVEDLKNKGINSVYSIRHKKFLITTGLNTYQYNNRKYKEVEDLLGADFWIDLDQFAEQLGVEEFYQLNDIDNPNKRIYKGDQFGYAHTIHILRAETWSQVECTFKKVDFYVASSVARQSVWREGHLANGKFPDNSKGVGNKIIFTTYGVKGGITYKISGRQFLSVNASHLTRAPEVNNIYISPRVRQDIVSGINNESVSSVDLNYNIKLPAFKLKITYYHTQIKNQVWVRTYWHDEYKTNVNLIMKGVNQSHQGLEIGFEKIFLSNHIIQGALGTGEFFYSNQPVLEAWQENNHKALFYNRKVYLQNYRVGGSPQFVSGIGYKYQGKRKWSSGIYLNYFDQIYLEPNPDRRTEEAIIPYLESEKELANSVTKQERLPCYTVLNCNAGKSIKLSKKYFMNLNLSINNLLNKRDIIVTGYEQLRWTRSMIEKFPPRYSYMTGLTYMATMNLNF